MNSGNKRILVIGGSGMIGAPIALALMASGNPVRFIARDTLKVISIFGPEIDAVPGDVTERNTLHPAMRGCHGVLVAIQGQGARESYFQVEAEGVANVAEAAVETGVERIVLISGATTGPDRQEYFERAKYLGEESLLEGEVAATILRPTWLFETLSLMIRSNTAMIPGKQPLPRRFLAVSDLARMAVAAFSNPEAAGKRLTVFGPEPLTFDEVITRFSEKLYPNARIVHIPFMLMRLICRFKGQEFRFFYDLMKYFEVTPDEGDPAEANRLLGAPTVTLDKWIESRMQTENG